MVPIIIFSAARRRREAAVAVPRGHFVYAKILDPIMPMERGDKYEDPLMAALEAGGHGTITGGGTQLGADNKVVWIGLDLELNNLEGALEFARGRLKELGAPAGSTLEYRVGEEDRVLEI